MYAVPMTVRQQDARMGLLLILPALIIILGIALQPILTTFYLSFFDASLSRTALTVFVGLRELREIAEGCTLLEDDR